MTDIGFRHRKDMFPIILMIILGLSFAGFGVFIAVSSAPGKGRIIGPVIAGLLALVLLGIAWNQLIYVEYHDDGTIYIKRLWMVLDVYDVKHVRLITFSGEWVWNSGLEMQIYEPPGFKVVNRNNEPLDVFRKYKTPSGRRAFQKAIAYFKHFGNIQD